MNVAGTCQLDNKALMHSVSLVIGAACMRPSFLVWLDLLRVCVQVLRGSYDCEEGSTLSPCHCVQSQWIMIGLPTRDDSQRREDRNKQQCN